MFTGLVLVGRIQGRYMKKLFASRFPEPVLVSSSVGRKSSVVKSGIEVNALADPGLIR